VVEPDIWAVHQVTSPLAQAVIFIVTVLWLAVHGFGEFGLTS
jgi:hypothetical protein